MSGMCCLQRPSEIDESQDLHFKKTIQQINNKQGHKRKKNTSTSKKRNKRSPQSPPVEELILRNTSVLETDDVVPSSKHVPGGGLCGINEERTLAGHADYNIHECFEEMLNRRNKFHLQFLSRIVNAVVNALLFVPQKMYAYVKQELELFIEINGDSTTDLPYTCTEPAYVAYVKGEEAVPFI